MRAVSALIGCEKSGIVRNAMLERGIDAWSIDLQPSEDGSNRHIVGNILDYLDRGFDMLAVMHPPCTRLCNSGVRWLSRPPSGRTLDEMWSDLDEGAALFSACWNAPIPLKAIENPVMHRHAKERIANYRPFAQSVQPWQFGDWETKRTCFWLDGLDPLVPTFPTIDAARAGLGLAPDAMPVDRVFRMPPGVDRAVERSRFFPGIAAAMADQWGSQAMRAMAA